mmetsp:Transcript_21761/g.55820  ORF Transcript_21761/g.55820 Transcript_21761/m.55820 type:complete len:257 (+) Transcript_21761:404-1174(+)
MTQVGTSRCGGLQRRRGLAGRQRARLDEVVDGSAGGVDFRHQAEVLQRREALCLGVRPAADPGAPAKVAVHAPHRIQRVPGAVDAQRIVLQVVAQPRWAGHLLQVPVPPHHHRVLAQRRHRGLQLLRHVVCALRQRNGALHARQALQHLGREELEPIDAGGLVLVAADEGVHHHAEPHIQRQPLAELLRPHTAGDALRQRPDAAKVLPACDHVGVQDAGQRLRDERVLQGGVASGVVGVHQPLCVGQHQAQHRAGP